VRSAIEYVHPFGVDVNSGTKAPDGFKDARKMEEFIVQAKASLRDKRNSIPER
jgi:phosphoribosylanthranilate isomerase